jgi:hypothetical protein
MSRSRASTASSFPHFSQRSVAVTIVADVLINKPDEANRIHSKTHHKTSVQSTSGDASQARGNVFAQPNDEGIGPALPDMPQHRHIGDDVTYVARLAK